MTPLLILCLAAADDPQPLKLITGKVVKIDGDTLIVSNSKDRKAFKLTSGAEVQIDRKAAKAAEISVGDMATVTYRADSDQAVKVQATSTKKAKAAPEPDKKAEQPKKEDAPAKKKAPKAQGKQEGGSEYKVIESDGGASFGPFRTKYGAIEVQGTFAAGEVELVVTAYIEVAPWTPVPKGRPKGKASHPFGNPPSIKFPEISRIEAYRTSSSFSSNMSSRGTVQGDWLITRFTGKSVQTTVAKFKIPMDAALENAERIELQVGTDYFFTSKSDPEALAAFNELFKKLQK